MRRLCVSRRGIWLLVLSLVAPWAAAAPGEDPGPDPACHEQAQQARPGPLGAASQVYVLDPSAAEVVHGSEVSGLELSPAIADGLSDSAEGLVQARSSVLGGGWAADLQGRFRHVTVATIQPDGSIVYSHDLESLRSRSGTEASAAGGQLPCDPASPGGAQ